MLGTCVGASNVTYDAAAAHTLARHDEMVVRFMASCQAIEDYRNSMSPHNHTRDGKVAEIERVWQFSTASYVKQAKLEDEKSKLETEKVFVTNKTHVKTLQADGVTYCRLRVYSYNAKCRTGSIGDTIYFHSCKTHEGEDRHLHRMHRQGHSTCHAIHHHHGVARPR